MALQVQFWHPSSGKERYQIQVRALGLAWGGAPSRSLAVQVPTDLDKNVPGSWKLMSSTKVGWLW